MRLIKKLVLFLGLTTLFIGQNVFANSHSDLSGIKITKVQVSDSTRQAGKCSSGSEYLILQNFDQQEVNLKGWEIWWEPYQNNNPTDSKRFRFKQDLILGSSEKILLYKKNFFDIEKCSGPQQLESYFKDYQYKILIDEAEIGRFNDQKDTISLINNQDKIVDAISYEFFGAENTVSAILDQDNNFKQKNGLLETIKYSFVDQNVFYNQIYKEPENKCIGVVLSEIRVNSDQQFIELYNATENDLFLDNCYIEANNHKIPIENVLIKSLNYKTFYSDEFSYQLDKNQGAVSLKFNDQIIDQYNYQNSEQDVSFARDVDDWEKTHYATPDKANIIVKCKDGQDFDILTSNCRWSQPKIYFSEITFGNNQYIELYNDSQFEVDLSGFKLVDNYGNYKTIKNSDNLKIAAKSYLALDQSWTSFEFGQDKKIELKLLNYRGEQVQKISFESLTSDKILIFDAYQKQDWTFIETKNLPNVKKHFKDCQSGKRWSQIGQKCITITVTEIKNQEKKLQDQQDKIYSNETFYGRGSGKYSVNKKSQTCQFGYEIGYKGGCVKKCQPGQYRSKITNRCRNSVIPKAKTIALSAKKTSTNSKKECQNGYEKGFTGTCVKKCQLGYQRVKETNRCRKKVEQFTKLDQDFLNTAIAENEKKPKINWWKIIKNPFFGAIIGGGLVYGYYRFGKK